MFVCACSALFENLTRRKPSLSERFQKFNHPHDSRRFQSFLWATGIYHAFRTECESPQHAPKALILRLMWPLWMRTDAVVSAAEAVADIPKESQLQIL